jgi:hypothetical protein
LTVAVDNGPLLDRDREGLHFRDLIGDAVFGQDDFVAGEIADRFATLIDDGDDELERVGARSAGVNTLSAVRTVAPSHARDRASHDASDNRTPAE